MGFLWLFGCQEVSGWALFFSAQLIRIHTGWDYPACTSAEKEIFLTLGNRGVNDDSFR